MKYYISTADRNLGEFEIDDEDQVETIYVEAVPYDRQGILAIDLKRDSAEVGWWPDNEEWVVALTVDPTNPSPEEKRQ